MRVAIVGAGWAGLAAAVQATQAGHQVTVLEAARSLGGRARGVRTQLPDGQDAMLDNGQHILIGAYTETLRLMQQVEVDPDIALLRLPLSLKFPDGHGLELPDLAPPLDALAGIARNRAWPLGERLGLLGTALRWRLASFKCDAHLTVAQLCRGLGPSVIHELIDPLCVSALNTPAATASAQVFLRVLQDALFGVRGGSQLLLPRVDLSALFPQAAHRWLLAHGGQVRLGHRVTALSAQGQGWQVDTEAFDAVVLACPPSEAARLVDAASAGMPTATLLRNWATGARELAFEAIATVYAWAPGVRLDRPLMALRHDATQPAQFVFDRGQLDGPPGLLAFVISASCDERDVLQAQVLQQARMQLGLELQAVQTIVEKHATFACTPGLRRPPMVITPQLLACGDYVAGPYPATLEGAVRNGVAAARALANR